MRPVQPFARVRCHTCVCTEKGSEVFAHRLAETVQQAKESGWLTPNEEEMKVNPLVKGTIYYGSRVSPIAVTGTSRYAHARLLFLFLVSINEVAPTNN